MNLDEAKRITDKAYKDANEKRYSDDQPRDDHGRFGSGSDSHEAAAKNHDAAVKYHSDAGQKLFQSGDIMGVQSHNSAASMHREAAKAHREEAAGKTSHYGGATIKELDEYASTSSSAAKPV